MVGVLREFVAATGGALHADIDQHVPSAIPPSSRKLHCGNATSFTSFSSSTSPPTTAPTLNTKSQTLNATHPHPTSHINTSFTDDKKSPLVPTIPCLRNGAVCNQVSDPLVEVKQNLRERHMKEALANPEFQPQLEKTSQNTQKKYAEFKKALAEYDKEYGKYFNEVR